MGAAASATLVAGAGFRRDALSGLFLIEHHQNDGFDLTPTTFDTTGAPFERVDFMGRAASSRRPAVVRARWSPATTTTPTADRTANSGAQEDGSTSSTFNLNVQTPTGCRAPTPRCRRARMSRAIDESSTATLAPPASTALAPGALDERLFKVDGSFSQLHRFHAAAAGRRRVLAGRILGHQPPAQRRRRSKPASARRGCSIA